MTALKAKPRRTIDDLFRLPPETRAELIEGEILMTPMPNFRHQRVATELGSALNSFVKSRGQGVVSSSPVDVSLPTGDVVQPDIVFISKANLSIVHDRVDGAPDLAIEILSPSNVTHDRIVKRDLYAKNGVKEYWIVDPDAQTVEVFTLDAGRYAPAGFFRVGEHLRSPLLPDFTAAVASLFDVA